MNTNLLPRLRLTLVILSLAAVLACASQAQAEHATVYQKTLPSTGFVVVPKESNKLGYGTCWIVDHSNRLVVTNVHVVTIFDNVRVAFPRIVDGELLSNSGKYGRQDFINGKVLARDSKRDLALIQLDRLPPGTRALELAPTSVTPGSRVWAVGNAGMAGKALNGGTLWRGREGTVMNSFFFTTVLRNTEQKLETRMITTDTGTKPGDSGGPMVDEHGRLIGVTSCTTDKGDFGVDVSEVRVFLARAVPGPNQAAPSRGIHGTWTVTWKTKDRNSVAGLTLNTNGTGSWDGGKLFPGTFSYVDGKLALDMPGSGVQATVPLEWENNDQFRFTVQFTDGAVEFTASRR